MREHALVLGRRAIIGFAPRLGLMVEIGRMTYQDDWYVEISILCFFFYVRIT